MEIKDLTGLSEPLKKLIEVVSQGVGALSKPYLIKKTADAKAYEIKVIAESIKENQESLKQIDYKEEKLSLASLNGESIKAELSIDERAQKRIDFREHKKQNNIENITQKAAEQLEVENNVSDEPVDEDWTSRFFNYAEDISNEEMQEIWARILAGEIKSPKSYSLRTLDVLRNLSKEEAEIFMKFASLAIHGNGTSFVLNFQNEELLEKEYGLNFSDRLLLEELGFLTANDLQYQISETKDQKGQSIFKIGNQLIVHDKLENKPEQQINILVFTKMGQELLKMVKPTPKLEYLQLLASKINRVNGSIKYGKILQEFPNGRIRAAGLIDIPLTEKEKESEAKKSRDEKK